MARVDLPCKRSHARGECLSEPTSRLGRSLEALVRIPVLTHRTPWSQLQGEELLYYPDLPTKWSYTRLGRHFFADTVLPVFTRLGKGRMSTAWRLR